MSNACEAKKKLCRRRCQDPCLLRSKNGKATGLVLRYFDVTYANKRSRYHGYKSTIPLGVCLCVVDWHLGITSKFARGRQWQKH